MSEGTLVALTAIIVPFLFTAWIINTSIKAKERKRGIRETQQQQRGIDDRELLEGMRNLQKRIENLEIIIRNKHTKE
jgi:hypothetical protein